jgi:SAM-dependent methyltransferase
MQSLIRDVYDRGATAGDDAERRFFTRVRLPSGVYKTTEPHRLDDVNVVAARLLPAGRPLDLMDVGASSAITTLEWSTQLTAGGITHRVVAADSHVRGEWLSFPGGEILLDRDRRHVLFADVFGRAVNVSGDSTRSALAVGVMKAIVRLSPVLRLRTRRVELVTPRLREHPAVSVMEDDIFEHKHELTGRFDALRAANVLNRHYFDDRELRAAVANLQDRLRPDGLLIVCRTHADGTNHGTFFRRAGSGWVVVERIGSGSEVEDIVMSATGPTPPGAEG